MKKDLISENLRAQFNCIQNKFKDSDVIKTHIFQRNLSYVTNKCNYFQICTAHDTSEVFQQTWLLPFQAFRKMQHKFKC